jgi:iron complex outermembrane receptor protein
MFGAVCRDWGQWRVQIDGRVEIVDRKILPFSPAFGLEIKPFSGMAIKLKAARSFRLPTFNDRFWQPGGDPGLSPESGWSKEAGLVFHLKTGSVRWQAGATGYDRRIRNWILWARQNGQPFFSPQNIAEVWSRGIESRIEAGIDMARWAVALSAGYDFARSTNEKTIGTPKIEKGAQLPYVPQHRVFGECAIQIRYLRLTLYQEYTGAVTGINQPVPGFGIGSLRAAYRLPFNRWLGAVFFYAGNLWNARYEVIERRPMPGRHFRAGFQAGVAKSGKQKHSTQ